MKGLCNTVDVIEAEFNSYFANWDIMLPQSAIAARRRGKIVARGWTIWFLFGVEGEREFLDFYAMHRMTNDRHLRLYSDGSGEGLRTLAQGIQYPRGATAEDEARIQHERSTPSVYADDIARRTAGARGTVLTGNWRAIGFVGLAALCCH